MFRGLGARGLGQKFTPARAVDRSEVLDADSSSSGLSAQNNDFTAHGRLGQGGAEVRSGWPATHDHNFLDPKVGVRSFGSGSYGYEVLGSAP